MFPEPVKKEDLPPDLLKAITEKIQEMHPGVEIKFLGDEKEGDLPPMILQAMDQQGAAFRDSLLEGKCVDCGQPIPCDWPLKDNDKMPEGWSVIWDFKNNPIYLTCDACDEARVQEHFPEEWHESLANGTCVCCKKKMPGPYPPKKGSALPEGWAIVVDDNDDLNFIICDDCDPPDGVDIGGEG